jgi:hypothetical protein
MDSYAVREAHFRDLSTFMMNGLPVNKLDLIAVVSFHGHIYFNVFRRYNSVYEIMFEDLNGDIYMQKDDTVRASLQQLLCQTDEQMERLSTIDVQSFKQNGPLLADVRDRLWSDIEEQWCGIAVNFGGVLEEYHQVIDDVANTVANTVVNTVEDAISEAISETSETSEATEPVEETPPRPIVHSNAACLAPRTIRVQSRIPCCQRTLFPLLCKRTLTQMQADDDDYMLLRNGTRVFRE